LNIGVIGSVGVEAVDIRGFRWFRSGAAAAKIGELVSRLGTLGKIL